MNVLKLEAAGTDRALKAHFPKMTGWGVFGSWATGTNLEGSDLDIWVKIGKEPEDLEIAHAKKGIGKKLGASVDVVVATSERLEGFREKSDAFYFSLYNGRLMGG